MKAVLKFSIDGGITSITATKELESNELDKLVSSGFTVVRTYHLKKSSIKDQIELEWNALLVKTTIKDSLGLQTIMRPNHSPAKIVAKFKLLKDQGWCVDKEEFVKKYWQ